jgi:hypothetical protein
MGGPMGGRPSARQRNRLPGGRSELLIDKGQVTEGSQAGLRVVGFPVWVV